MSTGRMASVEKLMAQPQFTLRIADVTEPGVFADLVDVTHIAHFAGSGGSAARRPIEMLRAASTGTLAALDLAARCDARIVIVTGVPEALTAPAAASYVLGRHGLENSCLAVAFDATAAGHIVAEAAACYCESANVGIVRPFEVYGPHLWPGDGRVTSTICAAAVRDQTLELADGDRRSFVYVTDAVEAVIAMLDSAAFGPVDIGGPYPLTTAAFARTAVDIAGSGWVEVAPAGGANVTRHPDLTRTQSLLGWRPTTPCTTDCITHSIGSAPS